MSEGENEKANENRQQIARNPNNDSPDAPTNPPVNSPAPDSPRCLQNDHLGADFEIPAPQHELRRSSRQRTESPYMKALRDSDGTHNGHHGHPPFPRGMQPVESQKREGEETTHADKEGTDPIDNSSMATGAWEYDADNVAYALVAGVTETEGLEPETIEEVRRWPDWAKWEEAVNAELRSLDEAHTWNVVERPAKTNVMSCKWVFKIKKNAAGKIDKYKARLVACGFTQQLSVDYDDTYTPVARLASIRLILAIAARQDWEVDVFDFHSTFLNGKLDKDEDIYMELPPGFDKQGQDLIAKLCVALYSSKQGALKWYQQLSKELATLVLNVSTICSQY